MSGLLYGMALACFAFSYVTLSFIQHKRYMKLLDEKHKLQMSLDEITYFRNKEFLPPDDGGTSFVYFKGGAAAYLSTLCKYDSSDFFYFCVEERADRGNHNRWDGPSLRLTEEDAVDLADALLTRARDIRDGKNANNTQA